MISFYEWIKIREMWFAPESGVTVNRRKPNRGLEGNELPKSLAPQPPNQIPGSKINTGGPGGGPSGNGAAQAPIAGQGPPGGMPPAGPGAAKPQQKMPGQKA